MERVEQVGEQPDLQVGPAVELHAERLEDGAEQVGGVEDGHCHQQQVKRVAHLLPVRTYTTG